MYYLSVQDCYGIGWKCEYSKNDKTIQGWSTSASVISKELEEQQSPQDEYPSYYMLGSISFFIALCLYRKLISEHHV